MCVSNKYDPQMPHICHMPKLLDMHQWGSMPKYMPRMNALALTMQPGAPYTDDSVRRKPHSSIAYTELATLFDQISQKINIRLQTNYC